MWSGVWYRHTWAIIMKVLKTLTLAGMPFPTRIDDGQFIPTTPTTSSNLNPPAMMSKSKFTLDSLINPIKRVVTVSPQNENFTEDGILRLSDGEKVFRDNFRWRN